MLPQFEDGSEMIAHAHEAHGIDPETARRSNGSLVEAVDGSNWYRNTMHFTVKGGTEPWCAQITEGKRDEDDPMNEEDENGEEEADDEEG